MQKQSTSKPWRCLLRRTLYPLFFISFLTVAILSFRTYYPDIVFNVVPKQEHVRFRTTLPSSLDSEIRNLQIQVGSLLAELRDQDSPTKPLLKFLDRVTRIAVSLDKFADTLSAVLNAEPSPEPSSHVDEDDTEPEEDGTYVGPTQFKSEEIKNYTSPKPNRVPGKKTFLGVKAINPTIGLQCVHMAAALDRFMTYEPHGTCPDDADMAYKLLAGGCEPLPRRRCFSRTPGGATPPQSVWARPDDSNIMWDHYKCKNYSCLVSMSGNRGFFKCSDCFDLSKRGWQEQGLNESAEFTIDEVLGLRPGEIRAGLDFSPTTGTFAALMREKNVTIASATLNLGAPFNEVISLRGLLAVHVSVSSRLPFYDNTLDIVHSTLFLDGWVPVELLQFVLYDWDRVLRPKGLLWIDRFFCKKEDLGMYVGEFGRLGYKKLMWRIVPKTDKVGDEVFLSAVLEKPIRG